MLKERARLVASVLLAIDLLAGVAGCVSASPTGCATTCAAGAGAAAAGRLYPLRRLPASAAAGARHLLGAVVAHGSAAYRSAPNDARSIDEACGHGPLRTSGLGAVLLVLAYLSVLRLDAVRCSETIEISRVWILMLFVGGSTVLLILAETDRQCGRALPLRALRVGLQLQDRSSSSAPRATAQRVGSVDRRSTPTGDSASSAS